MTDYEAKRKMLVLDMADLLMEEGNELYPWSIKNLTEAMQNFSDIVYVDFTVKAGACHEVRDNPVLNSIFAKSFNRAVYDYYRKIALEKAESATDSERELENYDRNCANQLRDVKPDED